MPRVSVFICSPRIYSRAPKRRRTAALLDCGLLRSRLGTRGNAGYTHRCNVIAIKETAWMMADSGIKNMP